MIGSLISGIERGAFAFGMAAVSGGGARPRDRVRVVRETSDGTITRLVAAVRRARSERDEAQAALARAHAENAALRRELTIAQATLLARRSR